MRQRQRASPGRAKPSARFNRLAAAFSAHLSPDERTFRAHALAHLRRFFGGEDVRRITEASTVKYGILRQGQGAATRTVVDELTTLHGILSQAVAAGVLREVPEIVFPPQTRDEAIADHLQRVAWEMRQPGLVGRGVPFGHGVPARHALAAPLALARATKRKPGPAPKITEDVWRANPRKPGVSQEQHRRILARIIGEEISLDAVKRASKKWRD